MLGANKLHYQPRRWHPEWYRRQRSASVQRERSELSAKLKQIAQELDHPVKLVFGAGTLLLLREQLKAHIAMVNGFMIYVRLPDDHQLVDELEAVRRKAMVLLHDPRVQPVLATA